MSTYAVLGATGNVGSQIVQELINSPSHVRAYCRSKEKLINLVPEILKNERIRIIEGRINDEDELLACIRGAKAVFLAIASTTNQPGISLVRDTSKAVIKALETLRSKNERLPKLIVLSSSCTEGRLLKAMPDFLHNMIYNANSNIYHDLEEAEKYLRSYKWICTTFIKPSILSHDIKKGHLLNFDEAKGPTSFTDLAAGMIETAEDETGRFDGKSVAVNPASKDVAIPWYAPMLLLRGLIIHYFPFTWRYIG